MAKPRFGLTLPNRGVIIDATTVEEMLEMATWADDAGWDSVFLSRSFFGLEFPDHVSVTQTMTSE